MSAWIVLKTAVEMLLANQSCGPENADPSEPKNPLWSHKAALNCPPAAGLEVGK